ncbi:hypothetical protein [Oryza sativa Japonica Group]|uniref:Uncharacterized protein n=1 Tax=Oryza sativa subsp. japonica TaxID=39947 RepID=Q5JKT5_ORYSJ|nr:hypothetical protein [Oryza sativa Japonica Group]
MATMNSTNPTLVRYSSVRLQAAGEERPNLTGEERPNHLCSPAADLFSGFGDQQKELVKQMGFDGLLSVRLTKLNKQFGAWILCKLDPSSGNLFAGSRHEICLTCEDVSLLLGIPCGRKEILPAIKNEVKDVKAYMCEIFEKDSFDGLTIVTIQRILEKKFNRTMTVHEQIVFKTTFIIFVVTKFLAPQSVNNHISIRYMKALVDVENIHKYNWAEFVLHDIKDAAAALQHKIRHRKSIGYINGCIILPQPFYLDNLDFGTDSPEHKNIPRIGMYNDSMIAEFIERDVILKNRNPFPTYGKMKLRNKHDEKYNLGHHTGATEAIWLDTQMQEEIFNVPDQVLAADEIQRFGGTDFMFATAGDDHWNPEDHLPSFKDDSLIPYDVPSCHLIFIPLLQPLHYSLYAFDMEKTKLYILDPLRDASKRSEDTAERHLKTKFHISSALKECMKLAFPD